MNQEAEEIRKLQPTLPVAALRGHLRDRLREVYDFPMQTVVRALVVGERRLQTAAPVRKDGSGGMTGAAQAMVARGGLRYLEIVPSGITREAAALTGPILFACDRRLGPGSVLTAALVLEDPVAAEAPGQEGPGLLARVVDYTVEVAVEP